MGIFTFSAAAGLTPSDYYAPDAQTLPYASRFSHDKETASPGYYSVMLDTYGVKAELKPLICMPVGLPQQ